MFPHVIKARHIKEHRVWLVFDDGLEGELDLKGDLRGPVFEPLRTTDEFARFKLDEKSGTLVWPNGADIAPEFLHNRLAMAVAAVE